ncbi:MAG: D-alanine--D-alanine ligase [Anaerolineae bacterium]|nr:D-alanine--D-alanine ligase [Anaerolineae bacterium]MBL6965333.1 D-alanine--D-alanine ligase [Anaerolineales bacterium]
MTEKLKVAVLFGGRSGEHAVSRMSARAVFAALDVDKYDVIEIGITHEGIWLAGERVLDAFVAEKTSRLTPVTLLPDPNRRGLYLIKNTPHGEQFEHFTDVDVYFPILHGTFGEDGTLQGLFEMANVAYVGAGVLGSSVGMDKAVFKAVMRANNIPVVDEVLSLRSDLHKNMDAILDQVETSLAYPVFVKPANMGSSVGVSKCYNRADLLEGLLHAAQFDRRILIERGINAREIEISVLGNDHPQASIPGEIRPEADFYSYDAKYHDDRSQAFIPADIPAETAEMMRSTAVRAYQAIDCAGMARVDFLLDKDSGEFYLNEVNTLPGFTQISMYPKLWEACGMSYADICNRLIELAVERRSERDQTQWRYEGER